MAETNIGLGLGDIVCFHTNFKTVCSGSVKNAIGYRALSNHEGDEVVADVCHLAQRKP